MNRTAGRTYGSPALVEKPGCIKMEVKSDPINKFPETKKSNSPWLNSEPYSVIPNTHTQKNESCIKTCYICPKFVSVYKLKKHADMCNAPWANNMYILYTL